MSRIAKDGDEFTAANGYSYRRVDGTWVGIHRLVMEEKLGRKLSRGERVTFLDGNRENLDPDNLIVRAPKAGKEARIHYLKSKIELYTAELDDLTR